MSQPQDAQAADVETRVQHLAHATDLSWVTAALAEYRDKILARWLEVAADQPFHRERREGAVADHIPRLLDALIAFLRRDAPRWIDPGAPLDDPDVLAAAQAHALVRAEQGLEPTDVVVEFRLLRQEIWHALRRRLPDGVPTSDVVGAELLVNDALDGAITVGLAAITTQIESVREDFLATTVHEVRQPITIIKGAAQFAARLLAQPQPDVARAREELNRIEIGANRMATQLATLVDVSRVALGQLELRPVAVDLIELVRAAVSQLGPDAGRITLTQAPGGDAGGRWDPVRLDQVIVNLLSNAVKYSPPGSPIEVTVRGDHDTAQLSIRDNGFGIAADDLPRLFRRYNRTGGAVDRDIEGLGLGLYLCRGIIQAHGGRIWAESPGLGQGATMHVLLPRRGPPDPEGP